MKRILFLLIGFIAWNTQASTPGDTTQLKPKPVYGKEAKIVSFILDNNHYRQINLDDSLSSVILDEYIGVLDNNRTYFTSQDIAGFEKYRYRIDDLTKAANVDPAYEIYAVFKERFEERMDYVLTNLVSQQFDYTKDEY